MASPQVGVSKTVGPSSPAVASNNLFVGNLSIHTTCEKLKRYFSRFGPVEDARIAYHHGSTKSRRFGFVTFCESTSTTLALDGGEQLELDGTRLVVKRAATKKPKSSLRHDTVSCGSKGSFRRVFIGGLVEGITQDHLTEYFSTQGEVASTNMPLHHKTRRGRGFAFITFSDPSVAASVCQQRFHVIQSTRVEAKEAYNQLQKSDNNGGTSLLGEHPIQNMLNHALTRAFDNLRQGLRQVNNAKVLQSSAAQDVRYSPYSGFNHSTSQLYRPSCYPLAGFSVPYDALSSQSVIAVGNDSTSLIAPQSLAMPMMTMVPWQTLANQASSPEVPGNLESEALHPQFPVYDT